MTPDDPLTLALARIFRPLIRFCIARGVRFPTLIEQLKGLYVSAAEEGFSLTGKRMTDSRLALLTGLQRKDIKMLRGVSAPLAPLAGPLPRIVALWSSDARYQDSAGEPRPLPRAAEPGALSFETLVAEVSRDLHARTILDELRRLSMIAEHPTGGIVSLIRTSMVPEDGSARLGYLGANLGDHATAAITNVLAAPREAPFFERAVHYNRLSEGSLDLLEARARELQASALADLNSLALELQRADRATGGHEGRFRAGAFVYREGSTADTTRETS